MKSAFIKKYWPFFFVIPWLVFYFYYVVRGNLTFIHSPYALISDERADLIHIENIQNSFKSFSSFFSTFFSHNPDPAHGFITYYFPALVSFFPKLFFGQAAIIFTHRMISAILMVGSVLILSFGFLKNRFLSFVLFLLIMGIPTINVFCFWPRCEAYMYFFMSLFLFFSTRSNFRLSWSYLFLGISVAARPGIVFYLPLFFLFPLFNGRKEKYSFLGKSLFFTLVGAIIAQPHYLLPSNFLESFEQYFFQLKTETGNRDYVNFSWWMSNVVPYYFPPRFYIGTVKQFYLWCFGALGLLSFSLFFSSVRERLVKDRAELVFSIGIILCSVFSLFFIFSTVQKVVNWYLQIYMILLFVGSFWVVDIVSKVSKNIYRYLAFILFSYSLSFFIRQTPFPADAIQDYSLWEVMRRPESELHQKLKKENDRSLAVLPQISKVFKRPLRVRVMLEQYELRTRPEYEIFPMTYPAPFYKFDPSVDIYLFYKKLYQPDNSENKTATGELSMRQESVANYLKYVVPEHGGKCVGKFCFTAAPLVGDLFIFFRKENEKVILPILAN